MSYTDIFVAVLLIFFVPSVVYILVRFSSKAYFRSKFEEMKRVGHLDAIRHLRTVEVHNHVEPQEKKTVV